jgi:hypothetical protein
MRGIHIVQLAHPGGMATLKDSLAADVGGGGLRSSVVPICEVIDLPIPRWPESRAGRRIGQHLEIGMKALEKLKSLESERLHSRKLRSFAEVAFQ